MYFRMLLLLICSLGLVACITAIGCHVRARRYYVEPQGLSLLKRALARFYPSNYATEGAVLARLTLISSAFFVYTLMGPAIYWARFGTGL